MTAAGLYTDLLEAWQDLGVQIQAVREALGVEVCSICHRVVPSDFRHEMFNGNQMGMCVEVACGRSVEENVLTQVWNRP